tara:strand:- start:2 stop:910 length:909 start_codon:yes stop_codon:yes gene_type:complete
MKGNNNIIHADNQANELLKSIELAKYASNSSSLKTYIIELTPELASKILACNYKKQRSISYSRVKSYVGDIKAGNWTLNGDTFAIDKNGELINGQHRCRAVVESGMSIPAIFIVGLDTMAFQTIDQNYARTTASILKMLDVPHYATVSALITLIMSFENHGKIIGEANGTSYRSTTSEIRDRYNQSPEFYAKCASIGILFQKVSSKTGFTGTQMAFVASLFPASDHDKLELFCQRMNDLNWTGMEKCPIKTLYRLIDSMRDQKMLAVYRINMIILCFHCFKNDKSLSFGSVRWKKDYLLELR